VNSSNYNHASNNVQAGVNSTSIVSPFNQLCPITELANSPQNGNTPLLSSNEDTEVLLTLDELKTIKTLIHFGHHIRQEYDQINQLPPNFNIEKSRYLADSLSKEDQRMLYLVTIGLILSKRPIM